MTFPMVQIVTKDELLVWARESQWLDDAESYVQAYFANGVSNLGPVLHNSAARAWWIAKSDVMQTCNRIDRPLTVKGIDPGWYYHIKGTQKPPFYGPFCDPDGARRHATKVYRLRLKQPDLALKLVPGVTQWRKNQQLGMNL